jgi:aryl-alcohol dehydrogenase (NADP+)
MFPLCLDQGIGVIPWSPLAKGFLMGNRTNDKKGETTRFTTDAIAHNLYYREIDFAIAARVGELAGRLGISRAQVALAWLLQKPAVTSPIIGATKPQHLEDNVGALGVKLRKEDIAFLEEPYQPRRVLNM